MRCARRLRVALVLGCATAATLAPRATEAQPARAIARATADRPVEIELRSAARALVPGATTAVAIRLRPNPGWHTYWRYAGDVGSAPSIAWRLPPGFTADSLRWPAPSLIASPPLASYGYEREIHLLAAMHVPQTARVGTAATLGGTVTWVACKVECIAGDVDLALTLPVAAVAPLDSPALRAFAVEEARVPRRDAAWTARASVDSADVVLRVRPPADQTAALRAAPSRIHFFVDSAGVLDHAAVPRVRVDGAELELRLRRSPYANGIPPRLAGVLTVDGADGTTPRVAVELDAPVAPSARLATADAPSLGTPPSGGLALLATGLLALLGGTLLNLMPCVLPVLSIKALGIAEAAARDGRVARRHALLFGAGVLAAMWALVGLLLALRAAGAEVGWGYQLQSPAVVGALALLIFAAALNMLGVFELLPVGGALAAASSRAPRQAEAFLSGVLVTALATPCSAPFLATAVAYGVTSGPAHAFVVFTALGLGLVWPVALVAVSPRVRRWVPKPGAWMITLRQALAFPLLATVVWLAWVRGRQAGVDAQTTLLIALTLLALGLWALGRFATLTASTRRRRAVQGVALAAAAGALALTLGTSDPPPATSVAATTAPRPSGDASLDWRPYSAAALDALRDSGRVILLDVTADWCLTCKVNERVAFGAGSVRAALRAHDVALVRADWTRRDAAVTRVLAAFGRNSVPFQVLYPRDRAAAPIVLPTLLTPGVVVDALRRAASTGAQGTTVSAVSSDVSPVVSPASTARP